MIRRADVITDKKLAKRRKIMNYDENKNENSKGQRRG